MFKQNNKKIMEEVFLLIKKIEESQETFHPDELNFLSRDSLNSLIQIVRQKDKLKEKL